MPPYHVNDEEMFIHHTDPGSDWSRH